MLLNVTSVNGFFGSITFGTGVTEDGLQEVTFAGDARPMAALADDLAAGEAAMVSVEPWQIIQIRELA